MELKIGTRGSRLALWQAETVKAQLENAGIRAELVLFKTEGDRNQTDPLRKIGGSGLFTKALDEALLNNEIDIAVHSCKDLPTLPADGLEIIAYLERGPHRDILVIPKEQEKNQEQS